MCHNKNKQVFLIQKISFWKYLELVFFILFFVKVWSLQLYYQKQFESQNESHIPHKNVWILIQKI